MMKTRFQSLAQHIQAVENESRQARADLKAAILALPDNPAIKRVGESPKCYTVSSSEIFARDNWTARFHDFKTQHQELCDFIDAMPYNASSDGDVVARMETVLRRGYLTNPNRERLKLHPEVCANVAKLLEIQLDTKAKV
jgi:hypothetical protein